MTSPVPIRRAQSATEALGRYVVTGRFFNHGTGELDATIKFCKSFEELADEYVKLKTTGKHFDVRAVYHPNDAGCFEVTLSRSL